MGWEIDDISVTDITSKPFWSFVPQRDECDPNGPTAIAPAGQATTPKTKVDLVGSGTHPKNLPLGFTWRQVAGPTVVLVGRDTAHLAFETPDTTEPVTLTFALRANDGALLSAPSNVDVIVHPQGSAPPLVDDGCGCRVVSSSPSPGPSRALWLAGLGGALLLARRRGRRAGDLFDRGRSQAE